MSGDMSPHDLWLETFERADENHRQSTATMRNMTLPFGDIMYPNIGNHDHGPMNGFAPACVNDSIGSTKRNYASVGNSDTIMDILVYSYTMI